ncbi:tetratricopeptide repeat protein [Hymenobacter lutimineralis]|uniref:histidine kinase n=1 Tax=Hymenobacter lutimineralis TaxID=2606448 RepID=A0A5D6UXK5_9BACT|nr:tetratricopeptide repeat protein [Hymenobacter lutimineralis]TYZ07628.1 tetratricopeptide repeat protein [Hymenobacter lutimineralis]
MFCTLRACLLLLMMPWLCANGGWAYAAWQQPPFQGRLVRVTPEEQQATPQPLPSPDPAESLRVARRQLELPMQAPLRPQAHMRMASALLDLRRYHEALEHALLALRHSQAGNDARNTAHTYDLLGRVQAARGDSGRAHQWYQRALQTFTQLDDPWNQGVVHEHLGDLYASQHAWLQAAESYRQASAIWQQLAQHSRASIGLHAVGRMYLAQGAYNRALHYLQQSARGGRQLHDSVAVGYVLHSMGQVYAAAGNSTAARQQYLQALAMVPRRQPPMLLAMLYEALADINDSTGNLAGARQNVEQAVSLALQSDDKRRLSNLYLRLSELHRRQGQYRAAFTYLTRHIQLADSVAAEQRQAEVAEIRMRYETEKKEQEIIVLQKQRRRQEANLRRQMWWRNGLGLGAVVLLVLAGALFLARRRQASINRLLTRQNQAIQSQKEELNRLNRSKDLLFSVISHDLRAPLSSLYTLLTLLNMGGVPPERLTTHMERLTRTLNSTLGLLDNLLNWAMAQMRDEGAQLKILALESIAAECVSLLALDAERKQVQVQNTLPACLVKADENMCRLILRNLLGNAIKFTSEGGIITLSGRRRADTWEISVADTGVGIAAADQEKLRQATIGYTTPGTDREEGTGLGLRLCREFAELNGGQLTFESVVGQGSVFRFTLPAAEASAGAG